MGPKQNIKVYALPNFQEFVMLFTSFLLSALLVGCNDSEKSETEKTSKFQKFDKTDINKAAEQVNPVPSPLKMSEMLQKAKIEAKVSKLVQVTKNPELKDDKESIAVQCGVLIA